MNAGVAREPRTLVFCTSYAASADAWATRYRRWLAHHRPLPWGEALLCMIDDGSPYAPPHEEIPSVPAGALPAAPLPLARVCFEDRLGRQGMWHYPGWWRSFLHSVVVARHWGCRKIIHVESDTYVLTRRMLEFLRALDHGWTAFWCPRWRFPETCVQVICEDQFDAMEAMRSAGFAHLAGQPAERQIPFTRVVREPHGNRYGEYRFRIPGYADFAAQVGPQHAVWFR